MIVATESMAEAIQAAAGFIAARQRGDVEGAEHLLSSFANESQRSLAFCYVAELAVRHLADATGEPSSAWLQEVSAQVAGQATM